MSAENCAENLGKNALVGEETSLLRGWILQRAYLASAGLGGESWRMLRSSRAENGRGYGSARGKKMAPLARETYPLRGWIPRVGFCDARLEWGS